MKRSGNHLGEGLRPLPRPKPTNRDRGCPRRGNSSCVPFFLLISLASLPAAADEVRIAVATNFSAAAQELALRFEEISGHRVTLISASTGKLYAQIVNGARLDAFLAADSARPERLEGDGLAVAGSRFTYARGRLALWSARPGRVDSDGDVLGRGDFRHLALANPRLAPYGQAARQTLEAKGLWGRLGDRLVRGENIGQTYQFVASGAAELGFVAYSQLRVKDRLAGGSFWLVPEALHRPIDQQAVLLDDRGPPRQFLDFLGGEQGRGILESYGYEVP